MASVYNCVQTSRICRIHVTTDGQMELIDMATKDREQTWVSDMPPVLFRILCLSFTRIVQNRESGNTEFAMFWVTIVKGRICVYVLQMW